MGTRTRRIFGALLIAIALTGGVAAQQQSGLVNVTVKNISTGDILSDNRVGIGAALNVIATVCGTTLQVGVLAQQLQRTGAFDCTNNSTMRQVVVTR